MNIKFLFQLCFKACSTHCLSRNNINFIQSIQKDGHIGKTEKSIALLLKYTIFPHSLLLKVCSHTVIHLS